MSNARLVAHVDSRFVSEALVRAEPEPPFTKTWRPWSHSQVIDAVSEACSMSGYEIGEKRFAIRPGAKMFAAWDIMRRPAGAVARTDDFCLSLGIRNSINKTFAVGLCAGERVFVCDNLVFSGSIVLFRKHTGSLEIEEVTMLAAEALAKLGPKFDRTLEWHNSMMDVRLTDAQAALLAVAAMRRKYPIIPPAKFNDFYGLYFGEGSKYTRTVHGFHGAVTEMFRSTDQVDLLWRTRLLVQFLDFEAKEIIGQGKEIVDLAKIEEKGIELYTARVEAERDADRDESTNIKESVRKRLTEAKKQAEKKSEKAGPATLAPKKARQSSRSKAAPAGVPVDQIGADGGMDYGVPAGMDPDTFKPLERPKVKEPVKAVDRRMAAARKSRKEAAAKAEKERRLKTPKEIAITDSRKYFMDNEPGFVRFGCGLVIRKAC